jgi:RinA family phage transcriptional activator
MGRNRISNKAWHTASDILLYYPDMKREYQEMVDAAIAPDKPENSAGTVEHKEMSDPTASAAIRLANNKRAVRLRMEIEAVEMAIDGLEDHELEVIRQRFWFKQSKGRRWPKSYDLLFKIPLSEREMHRVVQKVIVSVALFVGEI